MCLRRHAMISVVAKRVLLFTPFWIHQLEISCSNPVYSDSTGLKTPREIHWTVSAREIYALPQWNKYESTLINDVV